VSYEPDFVAETKTVKFLCEPKAASEMNDVEVLAKAKAAASSIGMKSRSSP
jgi:type III restriction enzyme